MPYSDHRPGRLDSQGRIVLDSESEDGVLADDDLDFLRGYEPTGSETAVAESPAGQEKARSTEDLDDLERAQGPSGRSG